jgi:hypothetical protein
VSARATVGQCAPARRANHVGVFGAEPRLDIGEQPLAARLARQDPALRGVAFCAGEERTRHDGGHQFDDTGRA